MAEIIEMIGWFKAEETLPDSDTTVLVIIGGDTEIWIGYLDGEQWRDADGFKLDNVLFWAHMPEGPKQ